jgi:cell division protein FtsI (penicillin-binding protein 3)
MPRLRLLVASRLLKSQNYLRLFLCTPLLFLPGLPASSGRVQALISLAILIGGGIMSLQFKHYANMSAILKIIIGIFVASVIATIAARLIIHKPLYFLGLDPDYMGLFSWLGILAAGIFWAPYYKLLLDARSRFIWLGLLVVCCLIGIPTIISNTPLMGVFLRPATVALIGNLLLISCLFDSKKVWWPGVLTGSAVILLTQDTLGILCLIFLLLCGIYWHRYTPKKQVILGAVLVGCTSLVMLLPGYFWSFGQAKLSRSTHETAALYSQSWQNFSVHQLFYNIGPATLTTDTNNQNPVPASIVHDLQLPGIAFGRHGLLYDTFIFFGGISALCIVVGILLGYRRWLWGDIETKYVLLYSVLLTYALLFPPNIFCTSLFFIVQFGILLPKTTALHRHRFRARRLILLLAILCSSLVFLFLTKLFTAEKLPAATSPAVTQKLNAATQKVLEESIRKHLVYSASPRGSAVLLDADTGTVQGLADVISDKNTACKETLSCRNPHLHATLQAWEPGSVMKPLLVAASLESGVTQLDDTFFDLPFRKIDDFAVYDAQPHEPETMRIQDVLNRSRNTGAIHVFEQFKKVGETADIWRTYLTKQYMFGQPTGIDASEASGTIPNGLGSRELNRQFTMSSYGIGVTVTPVQLAAAYASLVNGGVYRQPHLPNDNTYTSFRNLSPETSKKMLASLKEVYTKNKVVDLDTSLTLGGKTGTAPAYDGGQSYKPAVDIGVYAGFIQKNGKTYILVVKIDEPKTKEFASYAARDTWTDIVSKLY